MNTRGTRTAMRGDEDANAGRQQATRGVERHTFQLHSNALHPCFMKKCDFQAPLASAGWQKKSRVPDIGENSKCAVKVQPHSIRQTRGGRKEARTEARKDGRKEERVVGGKEGRKAGKNQGRKEGRNEGRKRGRKVRNFAERERG